MTSSINNTFIVMYYMKYRIYIKLILYECQDLLRGNSRSWNVAFANDLASLAIRDLSGGGNERDAER